MMNLNSELGGRQKAENRHLLVAKFKPIAVSLPYQKTKYNKKLKTSHRGGKTQIYYG